MGFLPLPKMQHCCYCTRQFRVACILIAVWSMLATTHSIRILYCPICSEVYTPEGGMFYVPMIILMWIFLIVNLLLLCVSFFFLLSLFLHIKKGYPLSADLFISFGFTSACLMIVHAVFTIAQIIDSDCTNPSDSISHILYAMLWMYFILIVNTYRDDMVCYPGVLVDDDRDVIKETKTASTSVKK